MRRVLIIEDNRDLAYGLRNNLEIEGYDVGVATDGERGAELALTTAPDLLILDLMMPRVDGFTVLTRLRKQGFASPVLILTAKGEEMDKVRCLRSGADDYVTKPFGLMELMARVEALLRRGNGYADNSLVSQYRFGDIEVNTASKTVTRGRSEVELAPKEYGLLVALLRRDGAACSRLELMQEVWGHSSAVVSRTVDTHIAELRRKLEDNPSSPRHILTVRKTGYRLHRS